MGSCDEAPSVALSKLEAAARHNRVLLHALQTCHPVMHNDRKGFIHTITFSLSGGSVDAVVYLAGSPDPLAPAAVSLAPEIT
ncbi:hypothetical protein ASF04_23785 [Duganella sp. Leaf61]|uniref:hypothetical protein n=1 Tax=Duganella sp. Leaf61 TaxID=1736227 RepID=UPI0006FB8B33|nr:hypothetical protein [Duganella sp. Leaf61]KQN77794.1 hypothetical protein ASF04_23785 [Duganella sp. Leaf61]